MTKAFNVGKAAPKDLNPLQALFQLTHRHTFTSRSPKDFKIGDYAASTKEEEIWIASNEINIIVGFVSVYSADNFIHNLFVHPDYQGKRIGGLLLGTAEQNLAKPITLKVAADNLKVCAFYEKHGWQRVSMHLDAAEPYVPLVK